MYRNPEKHFFGILQATGRFTSQHRDAILSLTDCVLSSSYNIEGNHKKIIIRVK